ncbi:hypothetical protein GCM10023166_36820 [Paeniglutamicibacter cryotolerans]|uniref:Uncharacterized protein n=1 Tax=Paeniglutamicibacter cryotolerans TaxID=670079 RepID=A0A839QFL0_9MICC|nr:hypothetical protein [Paeniglutamicibacter cryotolerans]MBB2995068.1 hypothetical protein [Paeniglutamicibacter cryotolerans]
MIPPRPEDGDGHEGDAPQDEPRPAPDPFGPLTGRRSRGVRVFMAAWLLLMGTTLLVLGGILLARAGNPVGVTLLAVLELAFIACFILLMREAGKR